ncbi:holo-[acyl-carrier-protein] synthase [Acetobacteraceae bacterium]|nr:holo-[acyl-carrier-protein] synthase [Acetobacteraceae bacterium]
MIIGIGIDLCRISRIEEIICKFGESFLDRIFAEEEREYADKFTLLPLRSAAYAKRWAAKEACAKALGTGFGKRVVFQDIVVIRDDLGAPSLVLKGGALAVLKEKTPQGKLGKAFLSLTDDEPFAMAQVILEAY